MAAQIAITTLTASSRYPRLRAFRKPASTIPSRLPAATADDKTPRATGVPNCILAIHASPMLRGPSRQKFSPAATTIKERRATSSLTYFSPSTIELHTLFLADADCVGG